jgi:hypothetical protein
MDDSPGQVGGIALVKAHSILTRVTRQHRRAPQMRCKSSQVIQPRPRFREETMTRDQEIIRRKLNIVELGATLGK